MGPVIENEVVPVVSILTLRLGGTTRFANLTDEYTDRILGFIALSMTSASTSVYAATGSEPLLLAVSNEIHYVARRNSKSLMLSFLSLPTIFVLPNAEYGNEAVIHRVYHGWREEEDTIDYLLSRVKDTDLRSHESEIRELLTFGEKRTMFAVRAVGLKINVREPAVGRPGFTIVANWLSEISGKTRMWLARSGNVAVINNVTFWWDSEKPVGFARPCGDLVGNGVATVIIGEHDNVIVGIARISNECALEGTEGASLEEVDVVFGSL